MSVMAGASSPAAGAWAKLWRDPRYVGCAFAQPLHRAIFDHIVAQRG